MQVQDNLVTQSGAAVLVFPPVPAVMLHRMEEYFIEVFQAMAEACWWPPEDWALWLFPLLSGEAQMAASRGSFVDVCGAILQGEVWLLCNNPFLIVGIQI